MSKVIYEDYKGQPMIVLCFGKDDAYKFSFGVKKAKLIIEHLDEIKKFISDNEKKKENR